LTIFENSTSIGIWKTRARSTPFRRWPIRVAWRCFGCSSGPAPRVWRPETSRTGLIASRRDSRSVIYSADYARITDLLGFLMEDCCQGRPEICAPIAALAACCATAD
jgi:hypothetical protein